VQAKAASGDLNSLVKMLVNQTRKSVDDFVSETLGFVMHSYYTWVKFYHMRPRSLDDFVDGLLYMELHAMQQREAAEANRPPPQTKKNRSR
jgi:hypothetical protein